MRYLFSLLMVLSVGVLTVSTASAQANEDRSDSSQARQITIEKEGETVLQLMLAGELTFEARTSGRIKVPGLSRDNLRIVEPGSGWPEQEETAVSTERVYTFSDEVFFLIAQENQQLARLTMSGVTLRIDEQ
jgi:hypothetical protein